MMPPLDLLRHNYRYITWADTQQLAALETIPPAHYLTDQGFAFKTPHDTAIHMAGAQHLWLLRFLNTPLTRFIARQDCPDLPALRTFWTGVHLRFSAYLEAIDPADLHEPLTWTALATGDTNTLPLGHCIAHALDHAAYHRAQLNSLTKLAGGTPARNAMYSSWCLATGAHRK